MKYQVMAGFLGLVLAAPGVFAQNNTKNIEAKVYKKDSGEAVFVAEDAEKTVCTNDGLERHVEIEYDDPTTKIPCKVHYRKTSEDPGHHQVLWSANSDAEYCQTKAKDFIAKLEGWGWSCSSN